jgi:hypothetical protein
MRRHEDLKRFTARKLTLNRETLRQLTETELRDAVGELTGKPACSGPTCSGWPPCTC